MLQALARGVFYFFAILVRGLNFLARAMSADVQSRTVIPPTSIGFGPSTLPAASHVCSVWRETPSCFAASPVEKVFGAMTILYHSP